MVTGVTISKRLEKISYITVQGYELFKSNRTWYSDYPILYYLNDLEHSLYPKKVNTHMETKCLCFEPTSSESQIRVDSMDYIFYQFLINDLKLEIQKSDPQLCMNLVSQVIWSSIYHLITVIIIMFLSPYALTKTIP